MEGGLDGVADIGVPIVAPVTRVNGIVIGLVTAKFTGELV
jgi:hypothetical protein